MSQLREQLLKIQIQTYRKQKQQIALTLSANKSVRRYAAEYYRHLHHYHAISSKKELLDHIAASDIVYHGDYHTLRQSQRSVIRIVRELVSHRKIILCLEMFHATDQKLIDAYCAGHLNEKKFLRSIEYARTWGFSWENYRPLLKLCKENTIPIIGINSRAPNENGSLAYRDEISARIIGMTVLRNPGRLVYVVDGDYHIAPDHLPRKVEEKVSVFGLNLRKTIVYQNAENLYWQLARVGLEESDILHIDEDSFCVMSSTPTNKLQSYLNWLEYTEDAWYPDRGDWNDVHDKPAANTVPDFVASISRVIGLMLPNNALDRLSIYYAADLNFMEVLKESGTLSLLSQHVLTKIRNNEGFLIVHSVNDEQNFIMYLPNSNVNMAAEESTHFIHALMAKNGLKKVRTFDLFYKSVITECLGFFGSKLINEKRKVTTPNALKKFLAGFADKKPSRDEMRKIHIAKIILHHSALEKKAASAEKCAAELHHMMNCRKPVFWIVSTQVGYILGDKLYRAVKKDRFPIAEVRALFSEGLDAHGHAFEVYRELTGRLK